MRDIWIYDLLHGFWFGHFPGIFTLVDDVFETPETAGGDTEAATDTWSVYITYEAKIEGEE